MSFDGIYNVYRHNQETQKYEKIAFYDKDGNELSSIFPSRDGLLNQLLLGYNRHGYDFEAIGAHRGLPEWYVDILKEEHPDWFDNDEWTYDVNEGTYYDYLELRGWAQGNICEFEDWQDVLRIEFNEEGEAVSEIYPTRNALKDFMAQVDICLRAYDIYYPAPGDIYIICEMSY